MARHSLLSELWAFMRARKKWWLLPIVLALLLVGLLIILGSSAAAPPSWKTNPAVLSGAKASLPTT